MLDLNKAALNGHARGSLFLAAGKLNEQFDLLDPGARELELRGLKMGIRILVSATGCFLGGFATQGLSDDSFILTFLNDSVITRL